MIRTFEAGMYLREQTVSGARGTLLFVHGLGESGLCFEALLEHQELADYHLLAPDLLGYGRSPWPTGDPLTLEEHADHLATWLRVRESGPVTLVGHSMGGVLALLLAEEHPDLVAAVVDVDGNKSPGDCVFSSQALEFSREEFLAAGFDALRDRVYTRGEQEGAMRGYYASLRLADPRAFHQNSAELVALSEPRELAARLAALPVPTVYLAGVPGGASDESHALLARAGVDVRNIEPSGHWPFLDQPGFFLGELGRFLTA